LKKRDLVDVLRTRRGRAVSRPSAVPVARFFRSRRRLWHYVLRVVQRHCVAGFGPANPAAVLLAVDVAAFDATLAVGVPPGPGAMRPAVVVVAARHALSIGMPPAMDTDGVAFVELAFVLLLPGGIVVGPDAGADAFA